MTTHYRVTLDIIEPDVVGKSILLAGGDTNHSDAHRVLWYLDTTDLELLADGPDRWVLLVNGPSTDDVLNTVARIGYEPHTVTVIPIRIVFPSHA